MKSSAHTVPCAGLLVAQRLAAPASGAQLATRSRMLHGCGHDPLLSRWLRRGQIGTGVKQHVAIVVQWRVALSKLVLASMPRGPHGDAAASLDVKGCIPFQSSADPKPPRSTLANSFPTTGTQHMMAPRAWQLSRNFEWAVLYMLSFLSVFLHCAPNASAADMPEPQCMCR